MIKTKHKTWIKVIPGSDTFYVLEGKRILSVQRSFKDALRFSRIYANIKASKIIPKWISWIHSWWH